MTISPRNSILWLLVTACAFPKPPDVPDDPEPVPGSCQGDGDCSGTTPFCVDNTCAVCRTSTTCPVAAPVCDETSHDCRSCAKDSECDSGACDLAAGTCVDKAAILYASPGGTAADPCTKMSPCSLRRAAEIVDTGHRYIVLEPGQYTGGARFDNKAATIVGIGATIETIDLATSEFFILNGSSIVMRDVNAGDLLSAPNSDIGAVIDVVMSELRVDNMSANTSVFFVIAASAGSILTLNHSRFVNTSVRTDGRLIANACTFFSGGPSVVGSVEITNSIVITDATKNSISISGSDPIHPTSEIINNTFVGGAVSCELVGGTYRLFEANIFFNHAGIQSSATCVYNYNLATPGLGTGASNIAGDPLFVDATNNDFHIKLHSPAIDATDPAALSNGRDFDGVVRPQGTRSDIGAFEYVPQNQPADHVVLGRH